jgi:tRNA U38,U39,U40 pseudouridine synthase TruA
MVRRIVAALIGVGTGRWDDAAVRAALATRAPAFGGAAAAARGLTLRRVVLGRRAGTRTRQEQGQSRTIEDE